MCLTVTELAEQINAAMQSKFVWNVDYNDLKYWLSKLLDEAMKAAQNVYLDNRPGGPGSSYDNAALNELYYFHPQSNSFGKFQRLIGDARKTLKSTTEDSVVMTYEIAYDTFQPIAAELVALKAFIKKGRKPSDDPTKAPPRTIDHTGTCPVCGRNIKIELGVMYSHGFVVKGYREGNCFGVGYPPIEVSDRGAKAFLGALKSQKRCNDQALESLKVVDQIALPDYMKPWNERNVQVLAKRGDPKFERAIKFAIDSLKSQNSMVAADIRTFEEVIRIWKPKALPDGNRDHMKEGGE